MYIYIYVLIDMLWINHICLYNMNHYDLYTYIYIVGISKYESHQPVVPTRVTNRAQWPLMRLVETAKNF